MRYGINPIGRFGEVGKVDRRIFVQTEKFKKIKK